MKRQTRQSSISLPTSFISEDKLITIHISYDSFTNLLQYGLTESVKADFIQICTSDSELRPGRVARVDGISTYVHADTGDFRAGSTFAQITSDDESEIESKADLEAKNVNDDSPTI